MSRIQDLAIDDEMRYRANKDINQRSITGSYIYLLIWFAIIIPHKFYITAPEICLWFTLTLIVLSALRLGLIFYFNTIYSYSRLIWKLLFFPIIWLAALSWGILCSMAITDPSFGSLSLAVFIATAGLTGGGVTALLPDRMLTIGLISAYLFPAIATLFFSAAYDLSVGLVFCIYWIGMYSVTKIQHREYWIGLKYSFFFKKHAAELEQLNTLDGLTGLKNRSFFDESLGRELKKAIRSQTELALLLIDIDHFKKINDLHGHLVGDECLRHLSKLLRQQIKRDTDTVARYGGEEFAAILPDMNIESTLAMAERIRNTIDETVFRHGTMDLHLTVSIGVSCSIPAPTTKKETIIEQADTALYAAKKNGRNQVVG